VVPDDRALLGADAEGDVRVRDATHDVPEQRRARADELDGVATTDPANPPALLAGRPVAEVEHPQQLGRSANIRGEASRDLLGMIGGDARPSPPRWAGTMRTAAVRRLEVA
jgi:hypothetical protein